LNKCPACGKDMERDEVDVGIGTIYGQYFCPFCQYVEETYEINNLAKDKDE
jgi:uncharacterized Zn finger protein (UPF0148 family)